MSRYRAVIFDFDGVIVDSEVIFTNAMKQFLEELGIAADDVMVTQFTGIPPAAVIPRLYELTEGKYQTEELQAGMENMFRTGVMGRFAEPMPGVQEFFARLQREGIRTALGTSRGRDNVLDYIRTVGLDMPFDVIVTHEDVTHGKPHPETFLKAAEKLAEQGIGRDEIVIIEDSENGIRAGRAAGIFTIGFKGSEVPQKTAEADIELTSYREISEYLFDE